MAVAFVQRGGFIGFTGVNQALVNTAGAGTAGNLLIGHICIQTGVTATISGTGWTLGQTGFVGHWAWAIVPPTPSDLTGVTFQWSGNSNGDWTWYEFSGADSIAPIGNKNNKQATSTTYSNDVIATTKANSRFINLCCVSGSQAMTTPTNYAADSAMQSNAKGSLACWGETIASSGGNCDSISKSITSFPWTSQMVEIFVPYSHGAFRRTLSPVGTRIGSRQRHGWG